MMGGTDKRVGRSRTELSARSERGLHVKKVAHALNVPFRSPRKDKPKGNDVTHRLVWDISAISVYTMRIAELLGKRIGVSGPQWMILMAIEELSDGGGLSVKAVAALLHVDSSFVSVQSKMLEKRDLIRRRRCMEDRRVMLLSLTEKAIGRLKPLISTRARLQESIRGSLDGPALLQLSNIISALRDRIRKETTLVATGE